MANPENLIPAKPGERRAAKDKTMDAREAFRLYNEEKEAIRALANESGMKASAWIREALVSRSDVASKLRELQRK